MLYFSRLGGIRLKNDNYVRFGFENYTPLALNALAIVEVLERLYL